MMETKEQDRHWHLVRNDNGEWISDENVVFLTKQEARHLQIMSKLAGKQISIQHVCGAINMIVKINNKNNKTWNKRIVQRFNRP